MTYLLPSQETLSAFWGTGEESGEDIVVTIRTLAPCPRNRVRRALAVWGLIIVQIQFLWAMAFHQHEDVRPSSLAPSFVLSDDVPSERVASRLICVACQIGRQGAAYLATAPRGATPDAVVRFRPASSLLILSLLPPATIFARAPPIL